MLENSNQSFTRHISNFIWERCEKITVFRFASPFLVNSRTYRKMETESEEWHRLRTFSNAVSTLSVRIGQQQDSWIDSSFIFSDSFFEFFDNLGRIQYEWRTTEMHSTISILPMNFEFHGIDDRNFNSFQNWNLKTIFNMPSNSWNHKKEVIRLIQFSWSVKDFSECMITSISSLRDVWNPLGDSFPYSPVGSEIRKELKLENKNWTSFIDENHWRSIEIWKYNLF